jgi:hypothetical protein
MSQPIVDFQQDDEGYWVGVLACGYTRHMRHQPPWFQRPWRDFVRGPCIDARSSLLV